MVTKNLVRDTPTFTRQFVYLVCDAPRLTVSDGRTIEPHAVTIDLTREKDRAPWQLTWLTVKGPFVKKNGEPGIPEGDRCYGSADVKAGRAPRWLLPFVRDTLKAAEMDRTGIEAQAEVKPPAQQKRCEEYAQGRMRGPGTCDELLDSNGYCAYAGDHIEAPIVRTERKTPHERKDR